MLFPIIMLITNTLIALLYLVAAVIARRTRPAGPPRYAIPLTGMLFMAAGGIMMAGDWLVGGSMWLMVGLMIILIWSESISPFHATYSSTGALEFDSLSHSTCLFFIMGGFVYFFANIGCVFILDVLKVSLASMYMLWGVFGGLLIVHGGRRLRWEMTRDDPRKDKEKNKTKHKRKNEELL